MFARTLFIVSILAFVFAIIGPRMGASMADVSTPGAEHVLVTQTAPVAATAAPQPAASATSLTRDADSHFRAAVNVNGTPLTMLVDSGASLVVLTAEDARRAGIVPDASAFTGTAQTAGGPVHVAPVTIDRIQIGGIERHDVAAAVMPTGMLNQSLLGQSFLSQVAKVTISGDHMDFR